VVSALFPLPFGTVISAGIAERSNLTASEETAIDGYRGAFEWSGGLSDAWAGMSARASSWLSFAAGARGTFGNMRSEVILQPPSSGPEIPVNTIYIDEALFRPCWGFSFSTFVRTGVVDIGAGIVTDRTGSLDVERDFAGSGSSTEDGLYTIPGELNVGVSARPASWLLLAADLHRRKTLNVLGSSVDEGGIASFGAEVSLGSHFAVRSGYSSMDGLWRPGSGRMSIGGGYRFSGSRAGVDLAVTRETWSDSSETGVFASLWASEIW
jgi:hypothetical protein